MSNNPPVRMTFPPLYVPRAKWVFWLSSKATYSPRASVASPVQMQQGEDLAPHLV